MRVSGRLRYALGRCYGPRLGELKVDRRGVSSSVLTPMISLKRGTNGRHIGGVRWMSSYPPYKLLELPKYSPTMETGNVNAWLKKEGDFVEANESIAEIETDKASVDFEVSDECYLAKILVPEGTNDLPIGTPLAVSVEEEEDVAKFKDFTLESAEGGAGGANIEPEATPEPVKEEPVTEAVEPAVPAAPATKIEPTPSKAPVSPAPSTMSDVTVEYEEIPMSKFRKITAARLTESKQTIPHVYLSIDCCIDEMAARRAIINSKLGEGESKVSVNDFVLKACAKALQQVPEVNAQWAGETIHQLDKIDLSVAVQTDRGLITPIVQDADRKGLKSISKEVRSLAQKAKDNALKPNEFMGGTFTVSNLGMFGVSFFSAVINPPQAAILAVGSAEKRVMPDGNGGFTEKSYLSVTLSCDHRVVDGAIGARWLVAFKDNIEDPMNMI